MLEAGRSAPPITPPCLPHLFADTDSSYREDVKRSAKFNLHLSYFCYFNPVQRVTVFLPDNKRMLGKDQRKHIQRKLIKQRRAFAQQSL